MWKPSLANPERRCLVPLTHFPEPHPGAVPLAALTAWQGLVVHSGLRAGQRVLVHGAAGGTGHFAVQIAAALGATVLATPSAGDRAFLSGLGPRR